MLHQYSYGLFYVAIAWMVIFVATQECIYYGAMPNQSLKWSGDDYSGAQMLESSFKRSVLECKLDCCNKDDCNVIVFLHDRVQDTAERENCFLARCEYESECKSVTQEKYYIFPMENVRVQPLALAPLTTSSVTVSLTTDIENKTELVSTQDDDLLITTRGITNEGLEVPQEDLTTEVSVITDVASKMTEHVSPTAARPTTVNGFEVSPTYLTTEGTLAADAVSHKAADLSVFQTIKTTADTFESINSTTAFGFYNLTQPNSFSNFTSLSVLQESTFSSLSNLHKPTFRHSIGALIANVVLGLILSVITVIAIYKTTRNVRFRNYKRVIFLLNDESLFYA